MNKLDLAAQWTKLIEEKKVAPSSQPETGNGVISEATGKFGDIDESNSQPMEPDGMELDSIVETFLNYFENTPSRKGLGVSTPAEGTVPSISFNESEFSLPQPVYNHAELFQNLPNGLYCHENGDVQKKTISYSSSSSHSLDGDRIKTEFEDLETTSMSGKVIFRSQSHEHNSYINKHMNTASHPHSSVSSYPRSALQLAASAAPHSPSPQERLHFLSTVPMLLAKALNSGSMEYFRLIVENSFLVNCTVKTTELQNEVTGRQFIIDLFFFIHKTIPDFIMEVSPSQVNSRVITTQLKLTGTRMLSTKTLDAIPNSYKSMVYMHLVMNKERTFIEHYISTTEPLLNYSFYM